MKQYQLTFGVPDDFNPEELEINVTYKDDIEIIDEGYRDFYKKIEDLITEKVSLLTKNTEGDNVVIFKFPGELTQFPQYITHLKEVLELKTDKTVIGVLDNVDILVQNADDAIEMLEGMIGKIKARALILRK